MKKNKLIPIVTFILGVGLASIGMYIASAISSSEIKYDNSKSGLTNTTLQGAIDELNTKATTQINNLNATITTLQTTNASQTSQINNLQNQQKALTSGLTVVERTNSGWTGVYVGEQISACYRATIGIEAYCTGRTTSNRASDCARARSTECCTGSKSTYYSYWYSPYSSCDFYSVDGYSSQGGGLSTLLED